MRWSWAWPAIVLAMTLAAPAGADAAPTRPFPIATVSSSANHAGFIASLDRSRAGEYAFFSTGDSDTGVPGEGVWLHRIAAGGRTIGGPVRITPPPPTPGSRLSDAAAAYDERGDAYLVTFAWWDSSTGNYGPLFAQRFAGDGRPLGEPSVITQPPDPRGDSASGSKLRYDSRQGTFLVTWRFGNQIYAQRLSADGHPLGSPVAPLPSTFEGVDRRPIEWDVQYDSRTGSWLMTWAWNDPQGEVTFARQLAQDGTPAGPIVRLVPGSYPRLGFEPRHGRFLLATAASPYAPYGRPTDRIYVFLLNGAGAPVKRGLRVAAPGSAPAIGSLGVAYSSRSDRVLLSWSFALDLIHQGIFSYPRVQRLDWRGQHLLGRPKPLRSLATPSPYADRNAGSLYTVYGSRTDRFLVGFGRANSNGRLSRIFGFLLPARLG